MYMHDWILPIPDHAFVGGLLWIGTREYGQDQGWSLEAKSYDVVNESFVEDEIRLPFWD